MQCMGPIQSDVEHFQPMIPRHRIVAVEKSLGVQPEGIARDHVITKIATIAAAG